jgi:hypothetical protein
MGFISTLIYTAQAGHWSITAIMIATVIAALTVVLLGIFALYQFVFIAEVKRRHNIELGVLNR